MTQLEPFEFYLSIEPAQQHFCFAPSFSWPPNLLDGDSSKTTYLAKYEHFKKQ